MWQHKIKRRPADVLFSDYIRAKAKWRCQNCGKDCSNNHAGLEASHYFGRRNETTRFDPQNVYAICKGCHWKFHEDKELHKKFVLGMIGYGQFDLLTLKAHTPGKKDDVLTLIMIKQLVKDLSSSVL